MGLVLSALVASAILGCAARRSVPDGGSAPAGLEASVRPGINAAYEGIETADDVRVWVERFEREGREVFDHRRELVAALDLEPGMDVADVGAGTGLFVPLLAEAVGPRGTVHAVDIVEAFLDEIARDAAEMRLPNVRTVLCTERSVELPPESVDRVFTCDTYHHFEYPSSTLSSILTALRPGGELLVVDFERIEGVSSEWILGHVRAGKNVVRSEIEQAGFRFVEEVDLLEDNYVLRFRKPE